MPVRWASAALTARHSRLHQAAQNAPSQGSLSHTLCRYQKCHPMMAGVLPLPSLYPGNPSTHSLAGDRAGRVGSFAFSPGVGAVSQPHKQGSPNPPWEQRDPGQREPRRQGCSGPWRERCSSAAGGSWFPVVFLPYPGLILLGWGVLGRSQDPPPRADSLVPPHAPKGPDTRV